MKYQRPAVRSTSPRRPWKNQVSDLHSRDRKHTSATLPNHRSVSLRHIGDHYGTDALRGAAMSLLTLRTHFCISRFDGLDTVVKRLLQDALPDCAEHESQYLSSEVLAVTYDDGVQIGFPI